MNWRPLAATIALLLAAPVVVGVGYGVVAASGGFDGEFAPALLVTRLTAPTLWRNLIWTLAAATAATALATAFALIVALTFRTTGPADRLARLLASLPLPVPPVVVATAGVLLLGQSGVLARLAATLVLIEAPSEMPALLYASHGIGLVLMLAWKELGFLSMLACTLASQLDPELEAAARSLGADRRSIQRRVVLPQIWRGLQPGIVAAFVFVVGSYELPRLLGPSRPQALVMMILERSRDADPLAFGDAHAAALLSFAAAAVAVLVHQRRRVPR
ncbi:MAG TPA: ABC transporter permease subunit [Gemmatimonadales bacterium]|nr:ABC transporter permease subunit [Gemmatimonadales bacterium]